MESATLSGGRKLFERGEELAAIEDRLTAAAEGAGSVLLIEGPAGIGKTELLAAARERAPDAGIEPLAARGGELEQSLGFGIVRQLFEERLARAKAAERRHLLADAASLAAPALGLEGGEVSAAPSSPFGDPAAAVHHGLYWLCVNLAERSPLLLLVDDLHWADPVSARWLVYLARRLEGLPVLVLAAMRPGEPGLDPGLLASLTAEPLAEVLRPGALSEGASAELIRERLDGDAEDAFCSACQRTTGGNPFLLGELIEALRRDQVPATSGSVRVIEELAPETISRSTLLRIARLPEGAQPLARAVAVLGAQAQPHDAAYLAGLEERTAVAAADALAATSIFAPSRPLRFAHPLLRAAIYEQIPAGERALAHARAARMLADEGAESEEVATQLLAAEPVGEEWAVDVLSKAASTANERGAPDAAIAYLRRALDDPASASRRVDLLRELVGAGVRAADWSACDGMSDDPVRELTQDSAGLIASASVVGPWLFGAARFEEGVAMQERAIAAASEEGENALAIRLEMLLLSVIQITPVDALERLERYTDRIEPGTHEECLWLAMRAWWQHFFLGRAAEVVALARRALEDGSLLTELSDTPVFGQTVLLLLRADELDEAVPWIDHMADYARQTGSIMASPTGLRAQLAYRRGDVAGAAEEARSGLDLIREHGIALPLAITTTWLVDALMEQGMFKEAEGQLRMSGLGGEVPDHYWFTPVLFSRARLRVMQGRTDEALDDLRQLRSFAAWSWPAMYPVASTMALALNSLGEDPEEARGLAEFELDRAREWDTPRAIGVALRAKGLIAGGEEGIELLREAVGELEKSPSRLEHARALTDLGAALRRANRRSEAREPLRTALDMAARCGATVIEERAREELAATGAKPRRVMLTGVESLTPSERRIARMAAEGMGNKQIAQALFVTVKTVEMHLGHAYSKLDISSRRELPGALGEAILDRPEGAPGTGA